MLDKNINTTKLEQIYIVADEIDAPFKTFEGNEEKLRDKLRKIYNETRLINIFIKIINGIHYLNLETLNTFEKKEKETHRLKKDNKNFEKLNREKLSTIFKCLGFNIIYCPQIAENILNELKFLLNLKNENSELTDCLISSVIIKQNIFFTLAKHVIQTLTGKTCRIKKYFNLSCLIINKTIPIIILLGGTSGTGKSTVSSLLASRLGISSVLSTDTIRHIMRNFISKEECGVLFASTYEAWKYADFSGKDANSISSKKKVINGYLDQCNIINDKLKEVIDNMIDRQESLIIEGVHLTDDIIKRIMKKHKYTFPFLIYIEKEEKHKERFAVRSRLMTLDAKYNKYVEHFQHIRTIQNYLVKKADNFLLPKIDNTNVDKSIGMIQETILRSFKDIHTNSICNYDEVNDNLSNYFNNFSKLKKTLLSSKEANILISQKVNKQFLLEKFFSNANSEDTKLHSKNIGSPIQKNVSHSNISNNTNNISTIQNITNSITHCQTQIINLHSIMLPNIDSNINRKPAGIKKESLSDDDVINKNLQKEDKSFPNKRLNYQMEKSNRRSKPKVAKNFHSTRTHREKNLDYDEKESVTASFSLNKLGSIDSESINERIKVINETDDELESLDVENSNSKNASYGSISEEDD